MIRFDAPVVVPIAGIGYLFLRQVRAARRLSIALWLAFCFTVPLAIYDWLYYGLYRGSRCPISVEVLVSDRLLRDSLDCPAGYRASSEPQEAGDGQETALKALI